MKTGDTIEFISGANEIARRVTLTPGDKLFYIDTPEGRIKVSLEVFIRRAFAMMQPTAKCQPSTDSNLSNVG